MDGFLAYAIVNALLWLGSLLPAAAPDSRPAEPAPACTSVEQVEQAPCVEVAPVP